MHINFWFNLKEGYALFETPTTRVSEADGIA